VVYIQHGKANVPHRAAMRRHEADYGAAYYSPCYKLPKQLEGSIFMIVASNITVIEAYATLHLEAPHCLTNYITWE
jgi:hypothetical protein